MEQCKIVKKDNPLIIDTIIDSTDIIDFKLIIQRLISKTLTMLINSVTHKKDTTYIIINHCMKQLTKNIYKKI